MKVYFIVVFLGVFFGNLFADSMISEDDIIANIPLKSNQVLLFDSRTQKAVGIIEVTQSGKIIKIPLPHHKKSDLKPEKTQTPPPETKNISKSSPTKEDSLINKNRQWDKKKIPYLIKEETIHKD